MSPFSSSEAVSSEYAPGDKVFTAASDQQLIESVALGDEFAFVELYSRYKVNLFNYLLRLLNDRTSAEDILQEVFVAVWNGSGRFKARSSVKTWLFRIAHNQAISSLRRQKSVVEHDEEFSEVDSGVDVEEGLLKSWDADQIHLALAELSPTHRAVVELSFVHGLSYGDIARIMNCPLGTVKSRMSYALKHLNGVLKQNDFYH
jgi:RNA polymerase sigma-70 factor (ECF subfamily)